MEPKIGMIVLTADESGTPCPAIITAVSGWYVNVTRFNPSGDTVGVCPLDYIESGPTCLQWSFIA